MPPCRFKRNLTVSVGITETGLGISWSLKRWEKKREKVFLVPIFSLFPSFSSLINHRIMKVSRHCQTSGNCWLPDENMSAVTDLQHINQIFKGNLIYDIICLNMKNNISCRFKYSCATCESWVSLIHSLRYT